MSAGRGPDAEPSASPRCEPAQGVDATDQAGEHVGIEGVRRHRETVVRRLLARGLSPTALIALLPDFRPIVERVTRRR